MPGIGMAWDCLAAIDNDGMHALVAVTGMISLVCFFTQVSRCAVVRRRNDSHASRSRKNYGDNFDLFLHLYSSNMMLWSCSLVHR